MIVKLEDDQVLIQVSGLEQLRLKAKLSLILGNTIKVSREGLRFPRLCLAQVSEILGITDQHDDVENALEKFRRHESARHRALKAIETNEPIGILSHWTDVLEPAQSIAVACMIQDDLLGLCLFDEQGSGKTVMTIAAFDQLKAATQIDAMIVVCPKSMVGEWPKDLNRFMGSGLKVSVTAGSSNSEKFDTAISNFDVLISNYEGVEPMLVPLSAAAKTRRFLLVVDESYYAKNESAQRSEVLWRLRCFCTRCFVLCGTPAPNSAHDLINQFNLADLGYTFGGFKKSKDPTDDWEKISALVESKGMYIRRLKEDILDFVPVKNFHVLSVPLSGKQLLLYEAARSELELELRSLNNEVFKKRVATYLQKRAALLQICCIPSSIDPTATDTPVKYIILDKLLEKLVGEGRKVIVWTYFTKSIEEVVHRYSRFNPARVDGSVAAEDRKKAVTLFQTDPNVHLFVGNPAAAGAGITLHSSYDAVYISYSNQAAHYLQSLDRIHRRGQVSAAVNYYLIVCEGSIEETEVQRLRHKELRQHDLLGDTVKWPTSLDDALAELSTSGV